MAKIVSRPTKAQKLFCADAPLSDADFSSLFDTAFPLPNNQLWTLTDVPKWLKFNVFKTLRGKRLALQQWTGLSAHTTGERGRRTSPYTPAVTGCTLRQTSSLHLLLLCGKANTALDLKSRFSWLKGLSGMSPKGSFWTEVQTHDDPLQPSKNSTCPSHNY
jgi:hypothetical protein